jgi:HD-GYP domain-containing protein (c-di-GMP phosphodiesterase class II)
MGSSEIALRMSSIRAGVRVTLALAAAATAYLALTPHGPHRVLIGLMPMLATVDGVVIGLLAERIARTERRYNWIVASWNIAHSAIAVAVCLLDGGTHSPFAAIFFISVAFAAASLSPRPTVLVAMADVLALGIVAAASRGVDPALIFLMPALAAIAGLGTSIATARARDVVELQLAKEGMLHRLARVIEYRDNETGEHTERMSAYCGVLARRLGWADDDARALELAATMHDVGKVAVPDAVLLKPGPLTPAERAVMERHTIVGHEMLAGSRSELIELAATIALTHHERVDGRGYPNGIVADAIPLAGRIVAVADVFDALTSDRVYRPAMTVSEGLRIIADGRGTQFDSVVLDAFEAGLGEILAIRSRTVREAQPAQPVAA